MISLLLSYLKRLFPPAPDVDADELHKQALLKVQREDRLWAEWWEKNQGQLDTTALKEWEKWCATEYERRWG